jgi:hypothetical protein
MADRLMKQQLQAYHRPLNGGCSFYARLEEQTSGNVIGPQAPLIGCNPREAALGNAYSRAMASLSVRPDLWG